MLENFHQRLQHSISQVSWGNSEEQFPNIDDIYEFIQSFENSYSPLLISPIWDDSVLDLQDKEFLLLLALYEHYSVRQSTAFLNGKVSIYGGDTQPIDLSFVYLLRFLFQDILQLRNLALMKFENQFNALFRNTIEKTLLIPLICFDYDFAKEYVFHENKQLTEKERYYKFLRPKKLWERIKKNYKNIIDSENKSGEVILGRIDKDKELYSFFANPRINPRIKEMKSFLSQFVHTHDMNYILSYYDEGKKYNVSLRHNASIHFQHRIDYCFEFLLWFFTKLIAIDFDKTSTRLYDIAVGYLDVIIKTKYDNQSK